MDTDDLKKRLADLHVLDAKTRQAERRILEGAEAMHDDLLEQIKRLRPAAMAGDEQARSDYMEAMSERGRLAVVIARARQALSGV